MGVPADLPLDGYYRGGPTYVGTYVFLRFDPDGFWFFQSVWGDEEPGFDFPAYLAALDVAAIKRQFPRGHCQPAEPTGYRYRCGRFTRQSEVPVAPGGVVVARLADALVLTSWAEDRGEFRWGWSVEVVRPATVRPTLWGVDCTFVPDRSEG
jgi:hypothetical protein